MTQITNWLKNHWQMLALTGLIYALWGTDLATPFKILVVFLHELSHAIVTILTGGKVQAFSISANQSGYVMSLGGSRFWTLTAGYLGSLLLGAGLFLAAIRSQADKLILIGVGITMLLITAFFIRTQFAVFFCIGTGLAMICIGAFLRPQFSDILLRVIGLSSILYVPYDIFTDTIRNPGFSSHMRSDAHMLAAEFGGTGMIWGSIWLIISVLVVVATFTIGLRGRSSNLDFRSPF